MSYRYLYSLCELKLIQTIDLIIHHSTMEHLPKDDIQTVIQACLCLMKFDNVLTTLKFDNVARTESLSPAFLYTQDLFI